MRLSAATHGSLSSRGDDYFQLFVVFRFYSFFGGKVPGIPNMFFQEAEVGVSSVQTGSSERLLIKVKLFDEEQVTTPR